MKSHSGCESLCFPLALSLISDLMPWNLFQLVSPCASPQLWYMTSCHEIPFSMWIPVLLLSSVSDLWPHAMKSLSACESLCFSSALSLILTSCHEIPFSMWVSVLLLSPYLWSLTSCHEIPSSLWVPMLLLSSVSYLWFPAMKSLPGCEFLCFFSALSLISDPMSWNPI